MLELNFPSVHRDDVIEFRREGGVPFCHINYEQADARHLAFIQKLIVLNRGGKKNVEI
jgi:hypothetical protein